MAAFPTVELQTAFRNALPAVFADGDKDVSGFTKLSDLKALSESSLAAISAAMWSIVHSSEVHELGGHGALTAENIWLCDTDDRTVKIGGCRPRAERSIVLSDHAQMDKVIFQLHVKYMPQPPRRPGKTKILWGGATPLFHFYQQVRAQQRLHPPMQNSKWLYPTPPSPEPGAGEGVSESQCPRAAPENNPVSNTGTQMNSTDTEDWGFDAADDFEERSSTTSSRREATCLQRHGTSETPCNADSKCGALYTKEGPSPVPPQPKMTGDKRERTGVDEGEDSQGLITSPAKKRRRTNATLSGTCDMSTEQTSPRVPTKPASCEKGVIDRDVLNGLYPERRGISQAKTPLAPTRKKKAGTKGKKTVEKNEHSPYLSWTDMCFTPNAVLRGKYIL